MVVDAGDDAFVAGGFGVPASGFEHFGAEPFDFVGCGGSAFGDDEQ